MRFPMRYRLAFLVLVPVAMAGCKSATVATAPAPAKLGIRPHGDETIAFDPAKTPPALTKVFDNIDANIDQHVENLQNWIHQPSISNSGEGIPESAEMVKGFFDKFGCQQTRVYDVGTTEYGSQGNPVVYAKCDFGAPKTLVFYWMYDTMPVTQPELWIAPPFEAKIVSGKEAQVPNAAKVLVGRGAINTKGGQMIVLNALTSMKEAMGGKLPVNVIFVAEGDEERMSIGLRTFMRDHSDLFKDGDALYSGGPSEGCVYVELTTSGKAWGKGPTDSDIHGMFKRGVDSPAWRHIQMLASLTSKDGNTPLIKGFFDNMEKPTPAELERLKIAGSHMNLATMARNVGVARFMSDDPATVLKNLSFDTSFNLDGIWGGNMYAGGAGAILPNKVTSKHNFRYVPKMNGLDIVKKLRAQLNANGYPDVEVKLVGDIPWSRGSASPKSDIGAAHQQAMAMMGMNGMDMMSMFFGGGGDDKKKPDAPAVPAPTPAAPNKVSELNKPVLEQSMAVERPMTGGYWPSYLFTDGDVGEKVGTVSMPMPSGFAGLMSGGRAHAANEYLVIEGIGKTPGMATAEKYVAAAVYSYAMTTTVPPRAKGK